VNLDETKQTGQNGRNWAKNGQKTGLFRQKRGKTGQKTGETGQKTGKNGQKMGELNRTLAKQGKTESFAESWFGFGHPCSTHSRDFTEGISIQCLAVLQTAP
jgi:hypothetical protein